MRWCAKEKYEKKIHGWVAPPCKGRKHDTVTDRFVTHACRYLIIRVKAVHGLIHRVQAVVVVQTLDKHCHNAVKARPGRLPQRRDGDARVVHAKVAHRVGMRSVCQEKINRLSLSGGRRQPQRRHTVGKAGVDIRAWWRATEKLLHHLPTGAAVWWGGSRRKGVDNPAIQTMNQTSDRRYRRLTAHHSPASQSGLQPAKPTLRCPRVAAMQRGVRWSQWGMTASRPAGSRSRDDSPSTWLGPYSSFGGWVCDFWGKEGGGLTGTRDIFGGKLDGTAKN